MPYVWYVTVNYNDGSSMNLRFADGHEQDAHMAWLEQTRRAKPPEDRRPRPGIPVLSVDPPRRAFEAPTDRDPVLRRSFMGIDI